MIAAFDCYYFGSHVQSAVCAVHAVEDMELARTEAVMFQVADDYMPGRFYKRELPAIAGLLDQIDWHIDIYIIDGYVDLATNKPGLGRHLFTYLGSGLPVIGIAKNPFLNNDVAVEVYRGQSNKPVYVTAAGMKSDRAASFVQDLGGDYRIPFLVKAVDIEARRNCRPL